MNIRIFKNLIYLLTLISFFGGIFNAQFINDGYHWGFIYSNALDLTEGKIPYKEIFLEYGILQVLINSLIIKYIGNELFFIYVFTAAIYSVSLLLISRIVFQTTNKTKISFYSTLCLLIMYPWPLSPWPVYLTFFFSTLFIYCLINRKFYFAGFYLFSAYLCFTTLFNLLILSFLISLLFLLILIRKEDKKYLLLTVSKIFIIFFIGIMVFFYYLIVNNIFIEWLNYQYLPFIIKSSLEKNFFQLIYDYIYFISIYPILNIINEPQWLFYSIIFFSNIFLIFYLLLKLYKEKNKKDLINITIITLYLFFISIFFGQSKNLTYTATSAALSIFSFVYIFSLIKKENKIIIIVIMSFITILSLFSYDMKNSNLAKNRYKSIKSINYNNEKNEKNSLFKYFRWNNNYWVFINSLNDIIQNIEKKCQDISGINYTSDTFIYLLFKNRTQKVPFLLNKSKFKLNKIFDYDLNYKVNDLIKSESLMLVSHKSHDKNYVFGENYSKKEIIYNTERVIKEEFNIYFPKKCY